MSLPLAAEQYQRVARVIHYCVEHRLEQPSLVELAGYAGLSEYHLQRLFSSWVGVSPKQFLKFLTKQDALRRLRQNTVLETALDCGLSGGGRLHDLMLSCEGVTPGQYQQMGKDLIIGYGFHSTPFGECLLAQTLRGVCKLDFFDTPYEGQLALQALQKDWSRARVLEDRAATAQTIASIFSGTGKSETRSLHLLLKGSPFQLKVWEALLRIPEGELCTYQQVADVVAAPKATRAVASAIARNNIGYLIPCHRVIRSSGEFSQYRWGVTRKQALIGWEACRVGRVTEGVGRVTEID